MLLATESYGKAIDSIRPLTSAYLHIPFCRRRCYYCDFPISVVGDKPPVSRVGSKNDPGSGSGDRGFGSNVSGIKVDRIHGSNSGTIAHYVEALCQEISLTPVLGNSLETVFFGGGTPSLLSVEQLEHILKSLNQQFGISAKAEISMEIDPATFDLEQLQGYKAAGVNRVSLGVQAFQQELLAVCGRSHTVDDIYKAIDMVHQAGFGNLSLDLMSGLPNQSLKNWQHSLEQAISFAPTHLSCYDLTVEAGTPFSRQYKPGVKPLPSDDITANMYRMAQRVLTAAGYDHYEISNYAKPGYQCRHNRVYWENHPFYGFGMGATSYIGGDRVARPRKTREYYEWLNVLAKSPAQKFEVIHPPASPSSTADLFLDTLMLGLRLAEGLDIAELTVQFSKEILNRAWKRLQPYSQKGWIDVMSGSKGSLLAGDALPEYGRLRLTDPEGFLFSNVILVALFEEFS